MLLRHIWLNCVRSERIKFLYKKIMLKAFSLFDPTITLKRLIKGIIHNITRQKLQKDQKFQDSSFCKKKFLFCTEKILQKTAAITLFFHVLWLYLKHLLSGVITHYVPLYGPLVNSAPNKTLNVHLIFTFSVPFSGVLEPFISNGVPSLDSVYWWNVKSNPSTILRKSHLGHKKCICHFVIAPMYVHIYVCCLWVHLKTILIDGEGTVLLGRVGVWG